MMKNLKSIILIVFYAISFLELNAQVTYNPSSNSNVSQITIKKISIYENFTLVDVDLYTTRNNYSFFFHRNMYIQKSGDRYAKKYYVREFVKYNLHEKYSAEAFTKYSLQLKFEKIPKGIQKIDIIEPYTEGYHAWYWKNITINNPAYSTSKPSIDNYFKYNGVKTLAGLTHPSNTFEEGYYTVYPERAIVEIYYKGGFYTKLEIKIRNKFFTKISVIEDIDFPPAFFMVSIIKELADEAMKYSDNEKETKNKLEQEIGKMYYDFDGKDISLFLLNLEWINY